MVMFSAFSAVWSPTDEALSMAADARLAFARAGLSLKEAAYAMGLEQSQLTRQLQCREHLSLWRMTALPGAFWEEFLTIRAKRAGKQLFNEDLAALVEGVRHLIGRRRMVRMGPPSQLEESRKRA